MRRFLPIILFCFLTATALADYRERINYEKGSPLVNLPFATENAAPRVVVDQRIKLDLEHDDFFQLVLDIDNPLVIRCITLSLKSGGGWYSCNVKAFEKGRQKVAFPRWLFTTEGSPAGYDRIETVRVSFWQGKAVDTSVKLISFSSTPGSVAIIAPWAAEHTVPSNSGVAVRSAMEEMGIPFHLVRPQNRHVRSFQNQTVVVLPMNNDLSSDDIALLHRFMDQGGQLIAFRHLPEELKSRVDNPPIFVEEPLNRNDFENKKIKFLELLGRCDPKIIISAFQEKVREVEQIGRTPDDDVGFVFRMKGTRNERYQNIVDQWTKSLTISSDPKEKQAERLFHLYMELERFRQNVASEYVLSIPGKPNEFRAWWEHAGIGVYPGDWDRTIRELSETGYTAVITNSLMAGFAHYESDVLPRSDFYKQWGDQIAQVSAAGKKYGIEVHIWKVNFYAFNAPKNFVEEMRAKGRMQQLPDGTIFNWLCPSHPDNRKLELDAMLETATKYDVDGIHFDYIRYPDEDTCYCDGCRERFAQSLGESIHRWPDDVRPGGSLRRHFADWQCDQITSLVCEIRRVVKAAKPSIKISAAVRGAYPECREEVHQDWPAWVDEGLLDFICTMNYTKSPKVFTEFVEQQCGIIRGRIPLYPGIGATGEGITLRPEEVALQIKIVRDSGLSGLTLYNLESRTMKTIPETLFEGPMRNDAPTKKRSHDTVQ